MIREIHFYSRAEFSYSLKYLLIIMRMPPPHQIHNFVFHACGIPKQTLFSQLVTFEKKRKTRMSGDVILECGGGVAFESSHLRQGNEF